MTPQMWGRTPVQEFARTVRCRLHLDRLSLHVEAVPRFGTDRHAAGRGRCGAGQQPALCDVVRFEPSGFRACRYSALAAAFVVPAPEHEPLPADSLRGDRLQGMRAAGTPVESRGSRDALPVNEDRQPRGVRRDRGCRRDRSVQPGHAVDVSRRQTQ